MRICASCSFTGESIIKGAHAKGRGGGKSTKIAAIAVSITALVAILALAACFATGVFALPQIGGIKLDRTDTASPGFISGTAISDTELTYEQRRALELKTAQVAELDGIAIRATVAPESLTGILFHQASYPDILAVETSLPTADALAAYEAHSLRINVLQRDLEGWMDADVLHLYRTGNTHRMDTAIDIGAVPGTPIYAPITGTVTLVAQYQLYGEYEDYRIHIQPDGRPDLDLIILHSEDPLVAAGDHVEAGVTQIASMRDIASVMSNIQLGDYTSDGGNHSHIQIGNANDAGYRKRNMLDSSMTGQETEVQLAAHEAAKALAAAEQEAAAEAEG